MFFWAADFILISPIFIRDNFHLFIGSTPTEFVAATFTVYKRRLSCTKPVLFVSPDYRVVILSCSGHFQTEGDTIYDTLYTAWLPTAKETKVSTIYDLYFYILT